MSCLSAVLRLPLLVFHARLLDDVLVASYCNSNGITRIMGELLLGWHTSWRHLQDRSSGCHPGQHDRHTLHLQAQQPPQHAAAGQHAAQQGAGVSSVAGLKPNSRGAWPQPAPLELPLDRDVEQGELDQGAPAAAAWPTPCSSPVMWPAQVGLQVAGAAPPGAQAAGTAAAPAAVGSSAAADHSGQADTQGLTHEVATLLQVRPKTHPTCVAALEWYKWH